MDVTFGPEGPKRIRRQVIPEDATNESIEISTDEQTRPETVRETSQNENLVHGPSNIPPSSAEPWSTSNPLAMKPSTASGRIDGSQGDRTGLSNRGDPRDVATDFESPATQVQYVSPPQETHPLHGAIPEQYASFFRTVLGQSALSSEGDIATSRSLCEGSSPEGRESLNLGALDYLASSHCSLDLLTDDFWNKAVSPESYELPSYPGYATANSPDLYMSHHHNNTYQELHSQFHNYLVSTARNMALTRQESAEPPPQSLTTQVDSQETSSGAQNSRSTQLEDLGISQERHIELWQNYLDEIAPWMDLFDNENHWRTTIARMAQNVDCLHYSLLALSARQQERKNRTKRPTESLNLYQKAIRLIMVHLPTLCTEVIAACVLLCVLEMMCSSPHSWGKHLDGCAVLLEAADVNGAVGGVRQALFWTFARMDVYKAYISDTVTTTPIFRWFISADSMSAAVRLFKGRPGSDSYANYVVFLCAGVVNILSSKEISRQSDHNGRQAFVSRWKAMYDLLEAWYNDRPEEMRPLLSAPPSKQRTDSPFSTILYSTPPGTSGNQVYHASMILLLQEKPKEVTITKSHRSILWHARQICGIFLSNSDHGALIHALQPVWIAGKIMSHHSEHKAILANLKYVEEQTGWATAWRAQDLRDFWGLGDDEV